MLVHAVAEPWALADHALDVHLFPGLSALRVLRLVQVPVFQDRPEGIRVERDRHVSLLGGRPAGLKAQEYLNTDSWRSRGVRTARLFYPRSLRSRNFEPLFAERTLRHFAVPIFTVFIGGRGLLALPLNRLGNDASGVRCKSPAVWVWRGA